MKRLAAACLIAIFSCSLASAQDKKTIGFSQIGAESAWRTAETKSIQDEAKKRNVDLKFSDAQGKQENQISALRAFIAQKVDAIILAPSSSSDTISRGSVAARPGVEPRAWI